MITIDGDRITYPSFRSIKYENSTQLKYFSLVTIINFQWKCEQFDRNIKKISMNYESNKFHC